jgi:ASC-1-like (ASCH) protein
MVIHQMKLAKIPFEKIARGQKTIESRLFDAKRRRIDTGDFIAFTQKENPSQKITVRVTALYRYATFDELFSDFPPVFFGGESKAVLLNEIHQFYSSEEERQFGVVGIRVKKE